jgi:uncharacterized protein
MSEVSRSRSRLWARIGLVRLLAFFVILVLTTGGFQVGLQFAAKSAPAALHDYAMLGAATLASLLTLGVYLFLVRWLEKRKATELSLLPGIPGLVAGLLLAFAMFCAVYATLFAFHMASWQGIVGYSHVMRFATLAIVTGVTEELIFRGGVYRVLEDSLGSLAALLLSGALFGGLHYMNPNATLFSSVAIALEAGVLLGAAYAATRNLWFPIGIHIGWNFTEGGVFGAAVSGMAGGKGVVNVPLTGPDLMTGGAFGPEASVVTVGVCLAIALYFIARTVRKRRWVPLSFHLVLD